LHFGKPKVLIFVPKCCTALIFAPKGPYGHRKDGCWTQKQCFNVLKQKYRITVPKVSVDLVYTIPLLFIENFFLTCFDFKISHSVSNDYPRLVLDQNEILDWNWSITLSLHFRKPNVPVFVPKCYTALIFTPKGSSTHRNDCSWTQTLCCNVLTQKYRITVPKVSVDFVYTIPLFLTQNLFLTCFEFKIPHLGPNNYPRLVLDLNWNFGLELKYNVVLAFWETISTYFCSKMLYNTNFCPKRTVWT
jgi:hypothetical protein